MQFPKASILLTLLLIACLAAPLAQAEPTAPRPRTPCSLEFEPEITCRVPAGDGSAAARPTHGTNVELQTHSDSDDAGIPGAGAITRSSDAESVRPRATDRGAGGPDLPDGAEIEHTLRTAARIAGSVLAAQAFDWLVRRFGHGRQGR